MSTVRVRSLVIIDMTDLKSGVHILGPPETDRKMPLSSYATLLGNILLRSIVVSVLIRLINGYSVTDGT